MDHHRPDLLSSSIPAVAILALALFLLAAWVGLHFPGPRRSLQSRLGDNAHWLLMAARALVGTFFFWAIFQFLGRALLLAASWSLWFIALLGGAAVEITVWLYGLERKSVEKRTGLILVSLRVLLVVLALFMFLQPILSREVEKEMDRYVVVLLDDSASMHFRDAELRPADKVRLARLYEVKSVRNYFSLRGLNALVGQIGRQFRQENVAMKRTGKAGPEGLKTGLSKSREGLSKFLTGSAGKLAAESKKILAAVKKHPFDAGTRRRLNDLATNLKRLEEEFTGAAKLLGAKDKKASDTVSAVLKHFETSELHLEKLLTSIPDSASAADQFVWNTLNEKDRQEIDAIAKKTRAAIARDLLTRKHRGRPGILSQVEEKYHLKLVRFASRPVDAVVSEWAKRGEKKQTPKKQTPAVKEHPAGQQSTNPEHEKKQEQDSDVASFRQKTDLAGALEKALEDVPPENLAGILLLTDGRHNGEKSLEDVAKRLGMQGSPVCSVIMGASRGPKDASLMSLKAPESIFLGERMSVRTELKADRLRGQKLKVKLMRQGKPIDEKIIDVPEDEHRKQLRFSDTPEGEGIFRYSLEVEPVEGELTERNNHWAFDVAVSDDRTNVLLVDTRPRWEYRYLRNLFYGRDKSIHLQYVLLKRETIEGEERERTVYASASRKFGDAEATHLPGNEREWLKFDAIILGDVSPGVIGAETMKIIQRCVTERGALLVLIAGPRYMPHAFTDGGLKDMLPIRYTRKRNRYFEAPEPAYRLMLTPEGRHHSIMQQSTSSTENAQIWTGLPLLLWRHNDIEAKEGATVLAYAESLRGRSVDSDEAVETIQGSARKLALRKKYMKENPLIVIQKYAAGGVVMLNFDRTWRLRYRIGDTYHHRFWGQVMRWGTIENLRAGTQRVRIGSDRLTYTAEEPIIVRAKLLDTDQKPLPDERAWADVYLGEDRVMRKRLEFRKDSNGIYQTVLNPIADPGRYRLQLESSAAARILRKRGGRRVDQVETEFMVVTTRDPVELAELSADRSIPSRLASLTGGSVTTPDEADSLLAHFGPGNETIMARRDLSLWDGWSLLILMVLAVSAEWILRKRAGLT